MQLSRAAYACAASSSGQITPTIDRSYPLSQTAAAIRYLQEGKACGKVVITV